MFRAIKMVWMFLQKYFFLNVIQVLEMKKFSLGYTF